MTSSEEKMKPHLCWLSPDPDKEEGPSGALPVPIHQRLSRVSKSAALPFPTRAACVYNQLLLATLYLLASREYFASHMYPFSFF